MEQTDFHAYLIDDNFFQTDLDDPYPWLQLDFGTINIVNLVLITPIHESMSKSNNVNYNDNNAVLTVHVGTIAAKPGELSTNEACGAPFQGEFEPKTFEIFECQPEALSGQYVLIQLQTMGAFQILAINEVVVLTALASHDQGY